jgi:Protein of unknown function (DUF2637)
VRHARDTRPAESDSALTRRATLGRRALAYALLIAVMGAVAAMSWAGLYAFAHDTMQWSPVHAALVPVALDIAAMSCALLALDSIGKGETAVSLRVLTACFVALSAWVNWRHAITTGNVAEQVFFPAMSILAYALVHAVMGKARREVRRGQHGQPQRPPLAPLPRTGVLAWVPFVGSPGRALATVRAGVAERLPAEPVVHRDAPATVVLEGLTQADAIRRAIDAVGPQPREVVAYLEANGWPGVATQRVYDVMRRDSVRAVAPADSPETAETAL